ncbi:MAG: hypothetical protein GIW98_00460 [Candidatus Eremiobacteraeota bacterium]|nr:hypothetical protein [Candidatus Eremiobacteraeota bacterium]
MNGMQMGPPQGGDILGTILVVAGTIVTLLAFVLAFRATFWPGETAPDHPKRIIFKTDR